MNQYLKNLSKIEFVVTTACTGNCKHCSQGAKASPAQNISPALAAELVNKVCAEYEIKTVMTFGGEPLLNFAAVFAVMTAAKNQAVPKRQLITNGYFTNNTEIIRDTVKKLKECGVNDLLLSVDAFHQETIPLAPVRFFAEQALACDVPLRLQPAWLVSKDDNNPYNLKTLELLKSFADLKIEIGEGNTVFPEGNALKYLSGYFGDNPPLNPYIENPKDLRCLSVCANGDLLGGNINKTDVMEIIKNYNP